MWLGCRRSPWAPVSLVLDVLAQDRRVRLHRLERVDQRRQRLVLDLDQVDRVGGDVAVVGDDERHLLVGEQDLLVRQHRLHVAGQRRHVVQVQGLQVVGGEDGVHARQRLGLADVDALDPGVAVGAADEVAMQHPRQADIVDIVALALDQAGVLLALSGAADAAQGRLALLVAQHRCGAHSAASLTDCSSAAACCTALMMFW